MLDDSELALTLVSQVLSEEGFDVRATDTLVQFDSILQDWQPHIILADVNMPDISGTELCRVLKRRPELQFTPIVLFSSLPADELRARAEEVGADGYLSKQAGVAKLPAELRRLCDGILW